jgi:hypothetical protein
LLFGIDVRSLVLTRILLGGLVLWDLFDRLPFIETWQTDAGNMPRALIASEQMERPWLWSFHLLHGSYSVLLGMWALHVVAAACLLVGFRFRLAVATTFILNISMQHRSPLLRHEGDDVVNAVLLWSLVLPMADCLSLDSALKEWRRMPGAPRSLARTDVLDAATAAIRLQCLVGMLLSAYTKSGVAAWAVGSTALYDLLANSQSTTSLGLYVGDELGADLFATITDFILNFESYGPLLYIVASSPMLYPLNLFLQLAVVAIYVALAVAILLFKNFGTLPIACITLWCVLVPSNVWHTCMRSIRTSKRTTFRLYWDPTQHETEPTILRLVRSFLLLGEAAVAPAHGPILAKMHEASSGYMATYLSSSGKKERTGLSQAQIMLMVAEASPALWLFTPLLEAQFMKNWAAAVWDEPMEQGTHSECAPERDGSEAVQQWGSEFGSAFKQAVIGLVSLLVLWNQMSQTGLIPEPHITLADAVSALNQPVSALQLLPTQPEPKNGWFLVTGTDADGVRVDATRDELRPITEVVQPSVIAEAYRSRRWQVYYHGLRKPENLLYAKAHAYWTCNRFRSLRTVELNFLHHKSWDEQPTVLVIYKERCEEFQLEKDRALRGLA